MGEEEGAEAGESDAKEESAMRLWRLETTIIYSEWKGCAHGLVVRAETEEHARAMAARNAGDEGPEVWLDEAKSYCRKLAHRGQAGVILRDYDEG